MNIYLGVILGDLKAILISSNPSVINIRQLLLRMVASLSRQRMSSTHLQLLLDLFKEEQVDPVSMKELLSTLLDLIQHDGNQPTHMLGFPALTLFDDEIGEDFFKVLSINSGSDASNSENQVDSASLGPFIHLNEVRVDIYSLAKHAMVGFDHDLYDFNLMMIKLI